MTFIRSKIWNKRGSKLYQKVLSYQVASPATVSRCGMIYMEPVSLGWTPLLISWLNTLPPSFRADIKDHLKDMYLRFCPPLLHLIRRCGVKVSASSKNPLASENSEHLDSSQPFRDLRARLESICCKEKNKQINFAYCASRGKLFSFPFGNYEFSRSLRPQEMITMPDANLTRSVMYLFDCFLDDFRDEKYVNALLDLDMRAQVEVSPNYTM